MDDILKRVLAVEREAAELVRRAEKEADKIAADARAEAGELEARCQSELQAEVGTLVETRLSEAEGQKRVAVEAAAGETREFLDGLKRGRERAVKWAMEAISLCDSAGQASAAVEGP